jgi:gentisate 1,2-dioxygenase
LHFSRDPSPIPSPASSNAPPEQDTIVYASRGHGSVISQNGKKRQELAPGDFALIPAWTEHQEVNDGDEEVTWIITRSGGTPVVVNLEGWGLGEKREQ